MPWSQILERQGWYYDGQTKTLGSLVLNWRKEYQVDLGRPSQFLHQTRRLLSHLNQLEQPTHLKRQSSHLKGPGPSQHWLNECCINPWQLEEGKNGI